MHLIRSINYRIAILIICCQGTQSPCNSCIIEIIFRRFSFCCHPDELVSFYHGLYRNDIHIMHKKIYYFWLIFLLGYESLQTEILQKFYKICRCNEQAKSPAAEELRRGMRWIMKLFPAIRQRQTNSQMYCFPIFLLPFEFHFQYGNHCKPELDIPAIQIYHRAGPV